MRERGCEREEFLGSRCQRARGFFSSQCRTKHTRSTPDSNADEGLAMRARNLRVPQDPKKVPCPKWAKELIEVGAAVGREHGSIEEEVGAAEDILFGTLLDEFPDFIHDLIIPRLLIGALPGVISGPFESGTQYRPVYPARMVAPQKHLPDQGVKCLHAKEEEAIQAAAAAEEGGGRFLFTVRLGVRHHPLKIYSGNPEQPPPPRACPARTTPPPCAARAPPLASLTSASEKRHKVHFVQQQLTETRRRQLEVLDLDVDIGRRSRFQSKPLDAARGNEPTYPRVSPWRP